MGHLRFLLVWSLQFSFISSSSQAYLQSDFIDKGEESEQAGTDGTGALSFISTAQQIHNSFAGQRRSNAIQLITELKTRLSHLKLVSSAIEIDRCSYNLRDPGIYRVTGEISRSPYHPVCSTFINSPAGETLNVTFLSVNILCGMGGAMVIDGWQLMDRFKGTVSYVPPEVETEAERKDFLCGQDVSLAPQPDHKMKLSQNYGQIVYDLKPTEELIFLVEFNTGNRADYCNNLIVTPPLEPQTIYLSTVAGSNCRLFIAGSVALTVDHMSNYGLDKTQTCGKTGPFLELQGGVSGWNSDSLNHHSFYCSKTDSEVRIPCKHVVLSLQNGPAEAKVTIRALEDSEREPWSYLCY